MSHREVSDELLNTAVELASTFGMKDQSFMVENWLGSDFRIHAEGLNDDRVTDKIKDRNLSTLDGSLRRLCRAVEENKKVLGTLIQTLENNVQHAESLTDRTR